MRSLLEAVPRPFLAGLAGLGLALALAVGPVLEAVEAQGSVAEARARLVRAQAAAARVPVPPPLVGADADALVAAFRARLEGLAAERAALLTEAEIQPDPARPALPRLRAAFRGTAEGLHGLVHALESEVPLMVIEEADLGVERPADPEIGRGTVMRLGLVVRGVVLPAKPEAGSSSP